ncbi:hypothetical protein [Sodalis sp. RH22]|uniref:hypothetical protein n=1 Tax=unclassified Sodalis (in: enterobacteria) TaxID=2636512 RepID=UPI0039B65A32
MPTSVTGVIPTAEEYNDLVTQEELTSAISTLSGELSSSSGGTLIGTASGTLEDRFTADEARTAHIVAPSSTDPGTANEGDQYFNTTDKVYKVYRSGAWVADDSAALALKLASGTGPAYLGYLNGLANAVQTNLYDWLSHATINPYMFGGIGDGVADDTSAVQFSLDAVNLSAGCQWSGGGHGAKWRITSQLTYNHAGNKKSGFGLRWEGAALIPDFGTVLYDTTNLSTGWTLDPSVTIDSSNHIVFTQIAQTVPPFAYYSLTDLTVGTLYSADFFISGYNTTQTGVTGIYCANPDGAAQKAIFRRGERGPGIYHAEFIATQTSHRIIIQAEGGNGLIMTINRVRIRTGGAALRCYANGSSASWTNLLISDLNIYPTAIAQAGLQAGVRLDDMGGTTLERLNVYNLTNGDRLLLSNLIAWSENITDIKAWATGCETMRRFTRPQRGSGLSSFARFRSEGDFFSGNTYGSYMEFGTAVYDSKLGEISGNITLDSIALYHLSGDQTDTLLEGHRTESVKLSTCCLFELGNNDNRRAAYRHNPLGTNTTAESLAFGVVSQMTQRDTVNYSQAPQIFSNIRFVDPVSSIYGPTLFFNTFKNIAIGGSVSVDGIQPQGATSLSPRHGYLRLMVHVTNADASAAQASTAIFEMLKGAVYDTDANVVKVAPIIKVVNNVSLSVNWGANSSPQITVTGNTVAVGLKVWGWYL